MDWVKLLTDFDGHPKVLNVGLAGAGLYARSLAYTGKYETDGEIPESWVQMVQANDKQVLGIEQALVKQGLWEKTPDGYRVVGFTEVNRSHEEMEKLRRNRSRAGKKGGKQSPKQMLSKSQAKAKQTNSYSLSNSSSTSKASRKKVNRKPVTDSEYELAGQIIAAFNEVAGSRFTAEAHLTKIVGRIREQPDLTAEDHRQVIEAQFRDPWWEPSPPSPQVIYGKADVFERAMAMRSAPQKFDAGPVDYEAARRRHRESKGVAA